MAILYHLCKQDNLVNAANPLEKGIKETASATAAPVFENKAVLMFLAHLFSTYGVHTLC